MINRRTLLALIKKHKTISNTFLQRKLKVDFQTAKEGKEWLLRHKNVIQNSLGNAEWLPTIVYRHRNTT